MGDEGAGVEPTAGAGPRRIGVVEDHRVTIAGLRQILAGDADLGIVATAPSVSELLSITTDLVLVVLDRRPWPVGGE